MSQHCGGNRITGRASASSRRALSLAVFSDGITGLVEIDLRVLGGFLSPHSKALGSINAPSCHGDPGVEKGGAALPAGGGLCPSKGMFLIRLRPSVSLRRGHLLPIVSQDPSIPNKEGAWPPSWPPVYS